MAKLIVNPDSPHQWEIPLEFETVVLGAGEDCFVPVTHPSVALRHCELTTREGVTRLRDLGSPQGTWIDGQPVTEVVLLPGQTIRMGEVLMRYENPEAVAAGMGTTVRATRGKPLIVVRPKEEEPSVSPTQMERPTRLESVAVIPEGLIPCRFHPKSNATFFCSHCHHGYCVLCLNERKGEHYCRSCSKPCVPLKPQSVSQPVEDRSFYQLIPGMFRYPFSGSGIWLMVVGSITYAVVSFLAARFWYAWLILVGYSAMYAQGIILSSANGEEKGPAWPDLDGDLRIQIFGACFQFLGTVVCCFAPAIAVLMWAGTGHEAATVAVYPMIMLGFIYLPMSLLAVALFDTLSALNPLVVLPAIARIPGPYAVAAISLALVMGIKRWIELGLEWFIPWMFVSEILSSFVGFYLFTVSMRMLGMLYYTQRKQIAWFRDA